MYAATRTNCNAETFSTSMHPPRTVYGRDIQRYFGRSLPNKFPTQILSANIDECKTGRACGDNEEWVNDKGSFLCNCKSGYHRTRSSEKCKDINECDIKDPCGKYKYVNQPGGYACQCKKGFNFNKKDKECQDINECEQGAECVENSECVNTAETDATVSISNQADKVFFVFFVSLSTVLLTDS